MGARAFYDSLTDEQRARLPFEWAAWRRKEQETPPGAWETWFVLAGRGFGKTKTGSEVVREEVESGRAGRVGLVGRTAADVRDVMVEGEALALSTPIATPGGWTSMGALRVGDVVFAGDGSRTEVVAVTEPWLSRPCFLFCADGAEPIVADARHKWVTSTRAERRPGRSARVSAIRTTEEIASSIRVRQRLDLEHEIAMHGALDLDEIHLPVAPYVLGAWLGDGDTRGHGQFTCHDRDATIVDRIRANGFEVRRRGGKYDWGIRGLRVCLRTAGVIGHKHVPTAYLRASAAQRLDLLRGLMDTDGYVSARGECAFDNTNLRLVQSVRELLLTLAFKPGAIATRVDRRGHKDMHRVTFTCTRATPIPFALPRKVARCIPSTRPAGRLVRRVDAVPSVPVRCIQVAHPSGTFLAGTDMVVTHNSGIRACSPPEWRPKYEPSKRRLVWPNGATATMYAADRPDQLRGPQHDLVWSDEFAAWRYQEESLSNIELLLRLGSNPRHVITTTPRPTRKVRDLLKGSRNVALACQVCRAPAWTACTIHEQPVVVTRGSTFDNAGNLVAKFFAKLRRLYEGTRLGRQELFAEVLDDLEGALWNYGLLERYRRKSNEVPPMLRIVVAVDPAESDEDYSNEHGIVIAGRGKDDRGYVLADRSGKMSPLEWAMTAVRAYYEFSADAIVIEDNTGGAAAVANVRLVDQNCRIILVTATTGKRTRAEPVASIYEQGRASHAGLFAELEDQMTDWTPIRTSSSMSPDRVDALVWAFYELFDLASSPFAFA